MIAALVVFVALLTLIGAALRLNARIKDAQARFRVLTGGYSDADLLAGARQRFRERQRKVETVVDTGTAGVASVHRTLAQALGGNRDSGADAYAWLRGFNRGVGATLSGLCAPGPRRHSESLRAWRARHQASGSRQRDDE